MPGLQNASEHVDTELNRSLMDAVRPGNGKIGKFTLDKMFDAFAQEL
jgi:hypothetical protein